MNTSANASGPLDLIADVGGTHARFALTDPASPTPNILQPRSLPDSAFASLQHAAEHYLAVVGTRPRRAAIAVASPVGSDEIRLTNRAWSFSQRGLRQGLGLDELLVLNDFGAVAWAAPALAGDDCIRLHGGDGPLQGPVTILGPGTGLGVAMLVGSHERGWQVVETEGGHVSFAPLDEEEHTLAQWLTAQFGRASNERVLSGQGLSHIDALLRDALADETRNSQRPDASSLRDPAAISDAALEGRDPAAQRALARFCAVLGSVAGDAALIHGARTVLIAGGIVPRFVPFLRGSAFRERFLAKGRFAAYLESVAIRVIVHPNPGLLGAAVALRHAGAQAGA